MSSGRIFGTGRSVETKKAPGDKLLDLDGGRSGGGSILSIRIGGGLKAQAECDEAGNSGFKSSEQSLIGWGVDGLEEDGEVGKGHSEHGDDGVSIRCLGASEPAHEAKLLGRRCL